MKRVIYGWKEQNECCYGIRAREIVDWDSYELSINEDGSVNGVPFDGFWYISFTLAKVAATEYWQRKIKVAREAIRDIKEVKKSDMVL